MTALENGNHIHFAIEFRSAQSSGAYVAAKTHDEELAMKIAKLLEEEYGDQDEDGFWCDTKIYPFDSAKDADVWLGYPFGHNDIEIAWDLPLRGDSSFSTPIEYRGC